MSEWLAVKARAEQRAQLNKYCGDPTFLERVEAFAQILNQVILLDVIWGEKSKPITGMRRNELVDVRGWRRRRRRSRWSGFSGLGLKLTYLRLQL